MNYIYTGINTDLVDKLNTNKLTKEEENKLIYKFLKINNISIYGCLKNKEDRDEKTLELRRKFFMNNIKIFLLTLMLIGIMAFLVFGYVSFSRNGLGVMDKVLLASGLLLFHLIIVLDIVMVFNIQRILNENILSKIKKYSMIGI